MKIWAFKNEARMLTAWEEGDAAFLVYRRAKLLTENVDFNLIRL